MAEGKVTRTALVTGAGSGMGRATSHRFARDGMAVGVLDINGEAAAAVAREINEAGGQALALTADVSDRAQINGAVARLREEFGPILVLVNNAAIENWCPFEDMTDELWDKQMSVNLKSMFIVTQAVLPDMLAAQWGRVVNISALGGQTGGAPHMAHYNSSKGGVIALTHSLAIEFGSRGITVNTVSPGFIDTPMARRAIDANEFPMHWEDILAMYPIPRLGKPEDIAAACAFFTSDEAGYITNQILGVNGGATN